MIDYPDGGLFPEDFWQFLADLGVIAIVAGIIAGGVYVWKRGPAVIWRQLTGQHDDGTEDE